ncbi:SEC14-like protein 2 [Orchesella cincta]|uniref:SEC14-like protein 2 n=1 Tax=Orchesella cincta TaxID=48709 RepID=A0A1D2NKA0_ORCCI|nr:SEC14-like protein 2 [Orchesella cincta]
MAELEPREVEPLSKLRNSCSDLAQDDDVLIRFLRARNLNVTKAEDMLRASLQWKKDKDIKSLLTEYKSPDVIRNDYLYKFTGYDKDGLPVLVVPYGKWEVRRVLERGLKEESLRHCHQLLENIMLQLHKSGKKQFTVVMDSSDMTFWKVAHLETIETSIQFFKDFEANYPETLKACYIVNSPWVFSYIYGFVRPLLSARTLAKVQIFDGNVEKWKKTVLDQIPPDSLPSNYGGTGPAFEYPEGYAFPTD